MVNFGGHIFHCFIFCYRRGKRLRNVGNWHLYVFNVCFLTWNGNVYMINDEVFAMKNKIEVILYNALSLLADETYEPFESADKWMYWVCNNLGCTEADLKEYGIDRENLRL